MSRHNLIAWAQQRLGLFFAVLAIVPGGIACTATKPAPESGASPQYTPFSPHHTSSIYESSGKIALFLDGTGYSGSFRCMIDAKQFRLELSHALRGRVAQMRMNSEQITYANIETQGTIQVPNTPQNRLQHLGVDLNIAELRSILWGRESAAAELVFAFDGNTLPQRAYKSTSAPDIPAEEYITFVAWSEWQGLLFPSEIHFWRGSTRVIRMILQKVEYSVP